MSVDPSPSATPLSAMQSMMQKRAHRLGRQLGWKVEFQGNKARLIERGRVLMKWTTTSKILQRLRAELTSRQREAGFGE